MKDKNKKIGIVALIVLALLVSLVLGNVWYFLLFGGIALLFHFARSKGIPTWSLVLVLCIVLVALFKARFPDLWEAFIELGDSGCIAAKTVITPVNKGIDSVQFEVTKHLSGNATVEYATAAKSILDSVDNGRWTAVQGQVELYKLDSLKLKKLSAAPQPQFQPQSPQLQPQVLTSDTVVCGIGEYTIRLDSTSRYVEIPPTVRKNIGCFPTIGYIVSFTDNGQIDSVAVNQDARFGKHWPCDFTVRALGPTSGLLTLKCE